MSFNKIILPGIAELKQRMHDEPDSTIDWIARADAYQGSAESVNYAIRLMKDLVKLIEKNDL